MSSRVTIRSCTDGATFMPCSVHRNSTGSTQTWPESDVRYAQYLESKADLDGASREYKKAAKISLWLPRP